MNYEMHSGIIEKIIKWCLAGNSRSDIIELIKSHSSVFLSNKECSDLLDTSKKIMERSASKDAAQAVPIHTAWYEKVYEYFHSIGNTEGANKAMQAKERLLALVENRVCIHSNKAVPQKPEVKYDFHQLSPEQKVRCKELYAKMGDPIDDDGNYVSELVSINLTN